MWGVISKMFGRCAIFLCVVRQHKEMHMVKSRKYEHIYGTSKKEQYVE